MANEAPPPAPSFFRPFEVGVLRALAAHEVPFAIIGGTAMHLHGLTQRPRRDLDLLVNAVEWARLRDAVLADLSKSMRRPILRIDVLGIDVLRTLDGVDTEEALAGAAAIVTELGELMVTSKDHLIASKFATWREKDIRDLQVLGVCESDPAPNLHIRRCAKCEDRGCIWNFPARFEGAYPPLDQDGRLARHSHAEALEPAL